MKKCGQKCRAESDEKNEPQKLRNGEELTKNEPTQVAAAARHQEISLPTSSDGDQTARTFDRHITLRPNLVWTCVVGGISSPKVERFVI